MNDLWATTYTTGPTTTQSPDWNELLQVMRRMDEEQKRIDAGMVKALADHIAASGEPLQVWARRLRIGFPELCKVLDGQLPPDDHFWYQVDRVFRGEQGVRS